MNSYQIDELIVTPVEKSDWYQLDVQSRIGIQLDLLLKEYQISQSHLAKVIHTSQAQISRIINEQTSVSVKSLERIAATFGKKLDIKFW